MWYFICSTPPYKKKKKGDLHRLQAKFLANKASWVISQGLCQPPVILVTIFSKLLFHALLRTQTPALSWLQLGSPTTAPWQLPGDGASTVDVGLQPPCTLVQAHLHRTMPCPATCAAPLQRPLTCSPAPALPKERHLQSSSELKLEHYSSPN